MRMHFQISYKKGKSEGRRCAQVVQIDLNNSLTGAHVH